MDYSSKEICFLDVLVMIKEGLIETSVYSKPTDKHTYLHFNSFHPHHSKQSIVFSQLIRYKRLCSRQNYFMDKAIELFDFVSNGATHSSF